MAYFERGGAVWHRHRQADRATLAAALQRLSLPQLEVAFEIEARYGGLEVDDDYQWLIAVQEPIRDLPVDVWLRRDFGDERIVQVAARATSNLYVDARGRIHEDTWELDQFVHSADSLEVRIERDAIFDDMAQVLGQGGNDIREGHHGAAIAAALGLNRIDEASDSRETWWQSEAITVGDVVDWSRDAPQSLIYGRSQADRDRALAICG